VTRTRRFPIVARRLLLAAACFAGLAGIAGLATACKSGEGERCQLDTDCSSGLVCNQATAECASETTSLPIDATTPDFEDAPQDPDAPVDAPDDAEPDV
jgi:hypothetical protein